MVKNLYLNNLDSYKLLIDLKWNYDVDKKLCTMLIKNCFDCEEFEPIIFDRIENEIA